MASIAGRSTESNNTTQITANEPQQGTRTPDISINNGGRINLVNQLNSNLWNNKPDNIPVPSPNLSQLAEAPPIQPQSPASPPTSNSDIDVFAGLAGTGGFTPPQNAATVTVFGDTGTTAATPSATSQALQNGQTVVFAESGIQITTETQLMAAKDA